MQASDNLAQHGERAAVEGYCAMRCMACGAEMTLINVVRDETMAIAGFQRHTFLCPSCKDVEHRLIFAKAEDEAQDATLAAHAAPPISPTADGQGESGQSAGLLRRVLGRLRGG